MSKKIILINSLVLSLLLLLGVSVVAVVVVGGQWGGVGVGGCAHAVLGGVDRAGGGFGCRGSRLALGPFAPGREKPRFLCFSRHPFLRPPTRCGVLEGEACPAPGNKAAAQQNAFDEAIFRELFSDGSESEGPPGGVPKEEATGREARRQEEEARKEKQRQARRRDEEERARRVAAVGAAGDYDHLKIDGNATDTGSGVGSVIELECIDGVAWRVTADLTSDQASLGTIATITAS